MNARSEMKERHELEEFLKTKKTDTVSLLEDEKTRSLSSVTVESRIPDQARMKSHRLSLQPSRQLTHQQRMNFKMDKKSSACSSSLSSSSSTMELSTADKGRMKSEGECVRGRRHSSLPSHELTFEQRLKIKTKP